MQKGKARVMWSGSHNALQTNPRVKCSEMFLISR